jgi:hypothetical protein
MRRFATSGAVVLCSIAAPTTIAAQQVFHARASDRKAMRIIQRDWCDLARYDAARRVRHLSVAMRRNLSESRQAVRRRSWGCRIARNVVHAKHERVFVTRGAWVRHSCPLGSLLPLRTGDRTAAARVAAAAEPAALRPVVWSVDDPDRRGPVQRCGKRVLARTVIVGLALTGYFPSASLSQRVVAVSHFRRYGWRTWLVLH